MQANKTETLRLSIKFDQISIELRKVFKNISYPLLISYRLE